MDAGRVTFTTPFAVLAEGLDRPEGVAWDPRGWFYAGGSAGQLYEVTVEGGVRRVADTGGFLLGLAVDGHGRIFACDMARHEVVVIDVVAASVDTYSRGIPEMPMRTPNYPAFAPDGTLYVTDSGVMGDDDGLVFRVSPTGETAVWSRQLTRFPNGCCLSLDGKSLYVAESRLPGVSRLPIGADGTAGAAEVVVMLPGTVPDGVAFDAAGGLYITCFEPDVVYRLAPQGPLDIVAGGQDTAVLAAPTNIAFGGEDLGLAVVANLKGTHLAAAAVAGFAGAPLHYPMLGIAH